MAAGVLLSTLVAVGMLRHRPGGQDSPLQRVARNSLFPMATSFLNKLMDLGFALYYLRVLGSEGVGRYTFAVVIWGYLDILSNFGLGTILTREVARDRSAADRYLASTLLLRLILWAGSLLLVAVLVGPAAGPLGIGPDVAWAILLLALGLLPSLVASTLTSLFQAHEKFEQPAMVTVFSQILKIGLGVAALAAGWGFVGLAGVSVAVNVAAAAALLALARTELPVVKDEAEAPGARPSAAGLDPHFCWRLLVLSYPLMLNNLLNSVFYRVDSLMLKPMAGDRALGWYGTAYKFIDGLGIISSSFTLALFPLLSRYARSSEERLARAFTLALKLLLAASLPIAVGTTLIADEIILLFAGPDYLPQSAVALQMLIWFLPFSFVNGVTQYLLIAIDEQKYITFSFLLGAAFNVVANLLLIPRFGFMGAAATTVASEWILMVPFWHRVRRRLRPIPLLELAWRPLLASTVMGLGVWALRAWSLPLAVAVAPPLYGAALLAVRGFDREELMMLAAALPWKRG